MLRDGRNCVLLGKQLNILGKTSVLQTTSLRWDLPGTLGFPGGSVVKNPSASARDGGDMGLICEDPLKEEMATQSSILVWEIPSTEEPGRLRFLGLDSNATA